MNTHPSRRSRGRLAVALILAATAAACGGGDEIVDQISGAVEDLTSTTEGEVLTPGSSSPEASPSETTQADEPVPPAARMPLTGEPLDSADDIPDRPALAVKIPNNPQALPQAGLNEADIVYEEIINDRITRFAAVFHSQGSDPLGPIRSGRAQDVDLLSNLNQPLFAWSGGNAGVTRVVNASSLVSLSYVGGYGNSYYRRDGRGGAPHNLFSDTETLWALAPDDYSVPTTVFPYLLPGVDVEGDPATTVEVTMDSILASWTYDVSSGRYLRSQYGEAHMTELTGQVWADNLVILFADYRAGVIDAKSPEAQTVGSGTVMVFSDGVVRTGVWSRDSNTDAFSFHTDATGVVELGLKPGRTFVEIPRNDPANVVYAS
jgi:hypothetical protein